MVRPGPCWASRPPGLLPAVKYPALRDFAQGLFAGTTDSFAAAHSGKWMSSGASAITGGAPKALSQQKSPPLRPCRSWLTA